MSKNFICKGCGEKFEKEFQSSTLNYCYICNDFYMSQKIAILEKLLVEKEADLERIREINLYNKDLADDTLKKLIESEKENKKLKNEIYKSNIGIVYLKNQLKQAKQQLLEQSIKR